jgi:hypothetical protein
MSVVRLLPIIIPVFALGIVGLVFALVARAQARMRAALEAEGIQLDTGPQWITIRYDNFRAPGFYRGSSFAKLRARLVLTSQRFVLTPAKRRYFSVPRSDLSRYTVELEGGELHIHSDTPSQATGSIDYRVQLADAPAWVDALTAAGAKPRPPR